MASHTARIHVDEDSAGRHRWALIAANGSIICDSGYSYTSEKAAMRAADTVIATAKSFADDDIWIRAGKGGATMRPLSSKVRQHDVAS